MNVPEGGVSQLPLPLPQHAIAPVLRSAHVNRPPPLIAVKLPVGAVVCPAVLSPQQAIVPVLRSPRV